MVGRRLRQRGDLRVTARAPRPSSVPGPPVPTIDGMIERGCRCPCRDAAAPAQTDGVLAAAAAAAAAVAVAAPAPTTTVGEAKKNSGTEVDGSTVDTPRERWSDYVRATV